MALEANQSTALVIPEERRGSWRPWIMAGMAAAVVGLGAWGAGFRPDRLWKKPQEALSTVEVDRGTVDVVVTEYGTLESADNTAVRCQVEALIGLSGTTANAQSGQNGAAGGQNGQAGGTGTTGAGGTQTQGATGAASGGGAAAKKGGAASKTSKAGGAKAKATGAGVASPSTTASSGASGGRGGAAGGAGGAGGATDPTASTGLKRPDVASFNYIVEPHIPLRGATPKAATSATATTKQQGGAGGGSGGGGRGGGGRGGSGGRGGGGGRGGSMDQQEAPGSTRIIWILPEGSPVKKGDVVCELDSAAFKDELQAQRIRFIQAKAWVEQAKSMLEVEEIAYREYKEGIYPQDLQLVRQYIVACQIEEGRAKRNMVWSQETAKKGFRAHAQVKADVLAYEKAQFALTEAKGMLGRLQEYTMPRIMKAREAKIAAIQSDLASQEATFQLETTRLKKLEDMIGFCTLRAPRDGIVAYANQANRWGQVEQPIQEGVTVRQTQPIFYVPDPKRMRVKARINESKFDLVHTGQRVLIRIDAFPDKPLLGTVAEITPIPAPSNMANMDVHVYYVMVNIDSGGFEGLRPGLSTEVDFHVDTHKAVTRVPVQAVRWVRDEPFVAVATSTGNGMSWQWKQVKLGLTDPMRAEVVSGLNPGDRVIAQPESLPPPNPGIASAPGGSRPGRS